MHLDLGGRTLSYSRRGAGERLLLIMGMAGHQEMWRADFLDLLAEDFEVVTFDHRGVGESTDVPGQFSVTDLAADAAALLDGIGWDRAHVFGISLGGMVAQELALQHPQRVRTLVLGCSYCGGAGSSLEAPGPVRMLEAMRAGVAEDAVRAGFRANLSVAWTSDESHWSQFSQLALAEHVPVPVVMRQAQAAYVHDTSARLPSLVAPTLVIAGTDDDMLNYANSELIASLIPNAKLLSLAGVGHLFWWERPDDVVAAIRAHAL